MESSSQTGKFSSIVGISEKDSPNYRPPKEEYIAHFDRLIQKMQKIIPKLEKPQSTELVSKSSKGKTDVPLVLIKKDAIQKKITELKINEKNENSYSLLE